MTLLDTENNPFFHGLDKVEPFFLDLDGNRRPDVFLMKNGIRLVLEYSRYEPPPPPPPPPNNNTDNTTSPENTTNNNTKPDNTSANDTTDNKNANARASSLEEGDWILKLNNFSSYIKRKASIEEEVLPPILFNPLKTHFASVVDWTGDCMADLVMMSEGDNAKILEFYKANGDGTLSEPLLYSVPKTVRTFSFSDASKKFVIQISTELLIWFYCIKSIHLLRHHHHLFNKTQPTHKTQILYPRLHLPRQFHLSHRPSSKFITINTQL
jgi:hypothetical protein